MKKITAVLVILLLSVALFADGVISMRLGGAFSLVAAKNPHCAVNKPTDIVGTELADYDLTMEKAAGFGFDAGFTFKLSSDYNMYMDFGMSFPSKVTVGDFEATRADLKNYYNDVKDDYEDDFTSIDGKPFLTNLEVHVGFTRNIELHNSPFALAVGGGLGYRRISSGIRFTARKDNVYYCYDEFETLAHISFDVNLNASYKISNKLSVGITLMPGVTFYSSSKYYATAVKSQEDPLKYNLEPIPSATYYSDDGMKPRYENSGFAAGFSLSAVIGVTYTF